MMCQAAYQLEIHCFHLRKQAEFKLTMIILFQFSTVDEAKPKIALHVEAATGEELKDVIVDLELPEEQFPILKNGTVFLDR